MPFRSDPDLQLILDTALDGVIVMRSDGTVADWNIQAERIFEWKRDEVVGREMSVLIIPERYRAAHHNGLNHYLATGKGPLLRTHVEITALRKSGEEFPVELSISPLNRMDQTLFLGFVRDISVRIASEADRARRTREAELLYRLTSLAADTSSLDGMLQLCLSSVCELMQWPIGHAFLPATSGEARLVSSTWVGNIAEYPRLKELTETTEFAYGTGLPGRIWQSQEPIWLRDIREVDWFPRGVDANLGIKAAFGFPIITAGEVVAILEFFNTVPTDLQPGLLLTARSMGDQIGRVLERQRVQARQNMLLHELDHRAKNMLAVVTAIASQTAKGALSLESFSKDYTGRLNSLSRSYSLLTASRWAPTTLDALVNEVIGPHLTKDRSEFMVAGGDLALPPKMALGIGMVLHELVTNAAKYGALNFGGRIFLTAETGLSSQFQLVHLTWKERGVTNLHSSDRRGFGSKLIEATARNELRGKVDVFYDPDGIRYEFRFPKPVGEETHSYSELMPVLTERNGATPL